MEQLAPAVKELHVSSFLSGVIIFLATCILHSFCSKRPIRTKHIVRVLDEDTIKSTIKSLAS